MCFTGKCLLNLPRRSSSMMGSVKTPHWTTPELAKIMAASQPPYWAPSTPTLLLLMKENFSRTYLSEVSRSEGGEGAVSSVLT